jgi:hypothetical protein
MRKSLVALLAALPLLLPVPPASAAAFRAGNCGYVPGHIYAAIVPYSTTARENPVTARVTCTLTDGPLGPVLAQFTAEGTGLVVGHALAPGTDNGNLIICTEIDFLSTPDPDSGVCQQTLTYQARWLVDNWTEYAAALSAIVDPYACPVLSSLSPGVPGAVDVEPEGDVRIAGTQVWDCPPYDD